MLMLLSESRDTVCSDSYLMETVKSTTLCPHSRTLQRVRSHRVGVNILLLKNIFNVYFQLKAEDINSMT